MLITPRNRTDRVFRAVYVAALIILAVIVLYSALYGSIAGAANEATWRGSLRDAVFFVMLWLVFAGQPFYAILLILSVWWFFRFPEHRLKFGIITAILVPWIIWSLHKAITMPFP